MAGCAGWVGAALHTTLSRREDTQGRASREQGSRRTVLIDDQRAVSAEASDRALAERVSRDGDERAFRVLYRRHTPVLYPFALRLLGGDELEAEDAVQETWIRATRALSGFRWEASLRTWLLGILLNVCRNLFRRRDRRWLELKEDPVAPVPGVDAEARIDLESAIALLPPGYRSVLVLHDVEGHRHEEIGALLEISPGTSKSQLFHARRALRALLGDEETRESRM